MVKSLLIFFVFCFSFDFSAKKSKEKFLIIVTYTPGTSDGIYVYKFNTETGENSFVSSVKTSNPSYLTISPNKKFVYAVNEDAPGNVTAFVFNKPNNKLLQVNQQPSQGKHPCYVTIDKTGKWVIVGNYSSGTLAVYPVNKDGSLGKATDSVLHEGSGVNSARQEA